jgi:hypothetical protein
MDIADFHSGEVPAKATRALGAASAMYSVIDDLRFVREG